MPPQQMTTRFALMEEVERTNTVVVRGQGQGMGVSQRKNPYTIEINRGRNCYVCGGFGHIACHCKNKRRERTMEGRRVEYGEGRFEGNIEQIGHLKEVENLEVLN